MLDLLSSYYNTTLCRRFWDRPPGEDDGAELSDAVVTGTSSVIVIECKAMGFNEAMLTGLDAEALMVRLYDILFADGHGAVVQLDRCINRLRQGALTSDGFDIKHYPMICPIVLLYFGLPYPELMLAWVREQAETHGLLRQERVAPVELLNFDDLEKVGALLEQGHSLEGLLQDKRDHAESDALMFTIFLNRKTKGGIQRPAWMRKEFEKINRHMKRTLFGVESDDEG